MGKKELPESAFTPVYQFTDQFQLISGVRGLNKLHQGRVYLQTKRGSKTIVNLLLAAGLLIVLVIDRSFLYDSQRPVVFIVLLYRTPNLQTTLAYYSNNY
ncbi:hypothetical protein ACTJJ0_06890 [Chitinophaga sp. 22321]|uniref:hypothetical protein n=1 Tax=Chitinophaga TaxID=79328 RepID=UPI003F6972E1